MEDKQIVHNYMHTIQIMPMQLYADAWVSNRNIEEHQWENDTKNFAAELVH